MIQIIALAEYIAKHFDGWTYHEPEEGYTSYRMIEHGSGIRLHLRPVYGQKRVTVGIGNWPKSEGGYNVGWNIGTPSDMTAATSRTTRAIAGDIQRKLIRPGLKTLEAFKLAIRLQNAKEAEIKHAHNMIATIPALTYVDHAGEWYGPHVRLRVNSARSCDVTISNIAPELAVLIAKFVPP